MNDNFCPLPWYNISIDINGNLRPCCYYQQKDKQVDYVFPSLKETDDLWNNESFLELRREFLSGEKPQGCMQCWISEKNTGKSFRTNRILNQKKIYENIDFNNIYPAQPIALDLKLSNACNQKCRICSPFTSSLFALEVEKFKYKINDKEYFLSNKLINTKYEDIFLNWLSNVKFIEFTGGEPFLGNENLKILNYLVSNNYAKDVQILFTTNGKFYNKKIIEKLCFFKKVNITISIDDIQYREEYQRYPSNWNKIVNNIEKFLNLTHVNSNTQINFHPTINNFNIFYLNELYDFLINYVDENHIVWNYVFSPKHFCISYLNQNIKNILIEKYDDSPFFNDVVGFLKTVEADLTEEFLKEVLWLDGIRDQSFDEVFPEWSDIIYQNI